MAPPAHIELGPLTRLVIEGARATHDDEYPAHQAWADELERLLAFLVARDQFDAFFTRLHGLAGSHRMATLAEVRVAFFLARNGFEIRQWEPIAVPGRPGDLTIGVPGSVDVFVEIKAPGWQGELARQLDDAPAVERQRILQRIREEKYRNAEARFVDPIAAAIDVAQRNAVPKLADDRPNIIAILDDLYLSVVDSPFTRSRVERIFATEPGWERVGAFLFLQVESHSGQLFYRCEIVFNPRCLPAIAIPEPTRSTLELMAAETRGVYERFVFRRR